VTSRDYTRLLFAIAFVVLVSAAMGAVIDGSDPPRGYEAAVGLFIALGVGAGLWLLSDWKRDERKDDAREDAPGTGGEGPEDGDETRD
jgi:hypothetical protein